jgi:hypothetical protein
VERCDEHFGGGGSQVGYAVRTFEDVNGTHSVPYDSHPADKPENRHTGRDAGIQATDGNVTVPHVLALASAPVG